MTNTADKIGATPTKLADGTWGAKAAGRVSIGDIVRICTRGGKEWDAKVVGIETTKWGDVLRTVSVKSAPQSRPAYSGYRAASTRRDCCGYRCPVGGYVCTPNRPCHDCA